jgi:shikimate kinase
MRRKGPPAVPDNLILVGFSCSGKTTLGRNVARRLRMTFVDSDRLIEEINGRTIPEIFREDGEAAFRELERQAIAQILSDVNQVVSTGGGAFVDPENRDRLRTGNLVIHLQVRPETVVDRLRNSKSGRPRPLLEHPDPLQRVIELMAERKEAYTAAHVTIGVDDRSRYEIVGELRRRWLAWQRAHHPNAALPSSAAPAAR